jgi:hypothetical protein
LAREVLTHPESAPVIGLEHFLEEMKSGRISLSETQRDELLRLLDGYSERVLAVVNSLQVRSSEYWDVADEGRIHAAITITLPLSTHQSSSAVLRELIGESSDRLLLDWGDNVDATTSPAFKSQMVLFLHSNNTARNRDVIIDETKTTQEEDFMNARSRSAEHGLIFADDLQATLICATLLRKAESVGIPLRGEARNSWESAEIVGNGRLNKEEFEVLQRLRDGALRTASGSLYLHPDGDLRARCSFGDGASPDIWAVGRER